MPIEQTHTRTARCDVCGTQKAFTAPRDMRGWNELSVRSLGLPVRQQSFSTCSEVCLVALLEGQAATRRAEATAQAETLARLTAIRAEVAAAEARGTGKSEPPAGDSPLSPPLEREG